MAGTGTEASLQMGLMPVAVESELHFDKDDGAMVIAVHNITRVLGRILWAITLCYFSVKMVAPMVTIIETILGGILAVWGVTSKILFWTIVPFHSFFGSGAFPSFVPLADRYIRVTGIIVALTETGSAVGAFLAVFMNGVVLHRFGAKWLLTLSFVWSCLMVASIILMLAMERWVPDRFCPRNRRKTLKKCLYLGMKNHCMNDVT